jgi:hypothetical protein
MLAEMAQNQAGQWFMAFGYQQNYQQPPCPLSRRECCKSRFAEVLKNSEGSRRGFRVEI